MSNKIPSLEPVYTPTAIYYREADYLEYVRRDVPSVSRRVDEYLTMVLDMHDRSPIGVKIKGFRHLYNREIRGNDDADFILLTRVFERVMTILGDHIFDKIDRKRAYEQAIEIAREDQVRVDTHAVAA